jgi:hypothetical protein
VLNVVMVQTGNYLGRGVEYVTNLHRMVDEHLTLPHRVYLLTDDAASNYPDMRVIPSEHRGWWEKLRIFKQGMFTGRVMFLDLDTLIVGNIDHIAAYDGHFATLHDFWRPMGLGPAVMLFAPEWADFIYGEWAAERFPMRDPRGDQGWIENLNQGRMRKDVDILQDMHPGEFVSYKTHCTKGLPAGARVVCFHGKPRPHEVGGWVRDYWKEAELGLIG